jgi:hypothetical protein
MGREDRMDAMSLLRLEHRRIESLACDMIAIVEQRNQPDPLMFFRLRREFARILTVHLKREDWVVYPRLLASPQPEIRDLARRLGAEVAAFSSAFLIYSHRWTTVCIAADWPGFCKDTLAILARLRHWIHVEDRELYPLVDKADHALPVLLAGGRAAEGVATDLCATAGQAAASGSPPRWR